MDRKTDRVVHRAAWSQLDFIGPSINYPADRFNTTLNDSDSAYGERGIETSDFVGIMTPYDVDLSSTVLYRSALKP